MSSTIIDETVILRYLLNDDEVLSPRAAKVIATRTARVYPEIITRVVVTLRDVYNVPRVEIAAAMTKLLDDVMLDEPTVIALAIKLFGKTHMDFTCLDIKMSVLHAYARERFRALLLKMYYACSNVYTHYLECNKVLDI